MQPTGRQLDCQEVGGFRGTHHTCRKCSQGHNINQKTLVCAQTKNIIEATSPSYTSVKIFPKPRSSPVREALVAVGGLLGVGTREVLRQELWWHDDHQTLLWICIIMNKFEGQFEHLQPLNKEVLILLQQQKLPKDHIGLWGILS